MYEKSLLNLEQKRMSIQRCKNREHGHTHPTLLGNETDGEWKAGDEVGTGKGGNGWKKTGD